MPIQILVPGDGFKFSDGFGIILPNERALLIEKVDDTRKGNWGKWLLYVGALPKAKEFVKELPPEFSLASFVLKMVSEDVHR